MRTISLSLLMAFLALFFSPSLFAQEPEPALPSVEEVNRHLDNLYRSESSKARIRMTINSARRGTRVLEMESWTHGEEKALFVIRSPSREAGTATLRTEEGLWNYAPRADRLVRIPTGMLSDQWMGSHLTNDDLVRETGYEEDYNVELSWGEEGGEKVLVATMIPKQGAPVVYTRVRYVLDREAWTPRKAEFFDGDRKVRTMTFSNVKEVNGRSVPHTFRVEPEDQSGEYTEMEYLELSFDLDVDESLFSRRGLRRLAR